MQAFRILLCFIGVARAAVNRSELCGVGKVVFLLAGQLAVTIGAAQGGVGRGPQASLVERRRDSGLALARAAAGFVATQAQLASRQGLGLLGLQGYSKQDGSKASGARNDQKTLSSSETRTICPSPGAFTVEFHITSYFQQCRQ